MNKNAQKLVAALRSGEYEQARDALRRDDYYCCLGVACDLHRKETGQGRWEPIPKAPTYFYNSSSEGSDAILPPSVQQWLGFATASGAYGQGSARSNLACDNDTGASFEDIAQTIEDNPEIFV